MSAEAKHEWKYDGGGGGHNGEYTFTCKLCGASDWVSYASMREGDKPNAAGCRGKVTPQRPHKAAEANPEAIARLRSVAMQVGLQAVGRDDMQVRTADLRALLDAHAALEAAHTEALDLLAAMEFDHLDNSKCPACRGWNMSSQGETPLAHTKDCTLAAILAKAGRR